MAGPASLLWKLGKGRWLITWQLAMWLYRQGRDRLERNLGPDERRELGRLMRRSKGRRANLTGAEQQRFRDLVRQAVSGREG